ncbi:cytochrome c [Undibacterium sp. GrIS 1.8]|uniref:cytochrome c n=1 Tax=Undibacterium sp. GrIS 1.8 TaxID=3143934 RepID=UPI003394CFC9
MLRRILLSLVATMIVAGLCVYGAFWRPSLAATPVPAANSFSPQLVEKGAVLAGLGNCASCHTAKGGKAFAGGYGLATPFGTIYSSNITPDPATGIGSWSQEAFKRAMHEGVRADGAHLFPAFPYTHFTTITDEDVTALYAYLMTRPPVVAPAIANTVPFPLSWRPLQAGWKLLYFKKASYETEVGKSVDWNRGRYLSEGVAHCAACHTPRNKLGAEIKNSPYLGANIDAWFAPALTAANTAPLPWTEDEIYTYLRSGMTALHGTASGPMAGVIYDGLAKAPDSDIRAMAIYFADMNGSAPDAKQSKLLSLDTIKSEATLAKIMSKSSQVGGQYNDHGANLYLAACASCHSNSNGKPATIRPELGLNSALTAAEPTNLIQVILHGIAKREAQPSLVMPGFAATMSDDDIAQIASYLRRSRTELAPWPAVDVTVAKLRKSSKSE